MRSRRCRSRRPGSRCRKSERGVRLLWRAGAPNPFSTSTAFTYELAATAPVRLRIVDVAGREVARLVEEVQGAGPHRAEWRPGAAPAGTYFAELAAGGERGARKLLYIK